MFVGMDPLMFLEILWSLECFATNSARMRLQRGMDWDVSAAASYGRVELTSKMTGNVIPLQTCDSTSLPKTR